MAARAGGVCLRPPDPVLVPIGQAVKSITLRVRLTGVRWFNLRAALGMWVIKLGARIVGVNLDARREP
jgi:hypothetical protein